MLLAISTNIISLFQITLWNNHFCGRLLQDSADTPNHEELPAGKTRTSGLKSMRHASTLLAASDVGSILIDAPIFHDNDRNLFDLSVLNSPWVDHSKLKPWCETTLRALQKFRVNHD
jgi:hypothetical protein